MMSIEQKFPNKRAFITGAASGLGLAICNRLASLLGAQIQVHSELGEGSMFYLELRKRK